MTRADFSQECSRRVKEGLVLSGNTYPIKDKIKSNGGIWDRNLKAWLMPDADTLNEMRRALPARQARTNTTRGCPECGRRHRYAPCGYPGCTSTYCDECNGGGRYCNG